MHDRSITRHGPRVFQLRHLTTLAIVAVAACSEAPRQSTAPTKTCPPHCPSDASPSLVNVSQVDAATTNVGAAADGPSAAAADAAAKFDAPIRTTSDGATVPVGDSAVPDGPSGPAPLPPNALEGLPSNAIVIYWGQNAAGGATGDKTKYEKPLGETCAANPQYSAIVLGFISVIGDPGNASGAPHISVSYHCDTIYDAMNPRIWRCPDIERDIIGCQQMGKKVLISVGGARGSYSLPDDAAGEKFAQLTWDMLLNGNGPIRPFGTAVFDGVDLDLEGGATAGYVGYVRKLRDLMKTDTKRRYLITAAPQCVFPDAFLGPRPGTVLGQVPDLLDYLFVQFYNNPCGVTGGGFRASLASWTKVGPKVLVGIPAAPGAALSGYVAPGGLSEVTGVVKGSSNPMGVMLWDASYDQLSNVNGKPYSSAVRALLP
jgi:chitinase